MKRKHIVVLIAVMLCVSLAGGAAAQSNGPNAPTAAATTKFTYQGQIKRADALFNGTCDMRFTLWDDVAAGAQLATYTPPTQVSVTDGVFAVEVDFGAQFHGEARWLQTEAKCADDAGYTTLPRVALNPTPYAIGLMPGAQVEGSISGSAGILRATNSDAGAALVGLATSATGATYGVLGNAFSPNGYAVFGYANDGATGVRGESHSTGPGVSGQSSTGFGVYGTSTTGSGVVGVSGSWVGVYGESANQTAVWGKSTTATGVVGTSSTYVGVWGESTSFEGVRGVSHNVDHGGVVGVNDAAGGVAVYGIAPNGGYAAWFNGRTKTNVLEITGGSDLAEQFNVSEDKADPGTLLIIDAANSGHLTISLRAYDTRVAGIVSGAGDIKPGLTLHQAGIMEGNTEVAIAGRVYVKATAVNGAIKPGDLLTTSDVAGYAMKATDRDQAYGAVIGKALTGLDKGEGLVLVLVNLQ